MEFIPGRTLSEALADGPLALGSVADIGSAVADALAAAHEAGLVHRDVKPANIMVTSSSGQVKVLDFGLAKPVAELLGDGDLTTRVPLTTPGAVVGTLAYMSSEQTRGETLDSATDVFSLGCVLYEAAIGRRPFNGANPLQLMHAVATVDPPPPSTIDTGIPGEFDQILQRALAKERTRRPSARNLAAALRHFGAGLTGVATRAGEADVSDEEPDAFVGRERELQRLDILLRQALKGTSTIVFLTGEPGIGKTAVVEEFRRRARQEYRPLLLARGRCVEQYGPGEAYLLFLDGLAALLGTPAGGRVASILRTHAPTWCLQLPASFGSSGALDQLQRDTIGATKDRMMRELGDALIAMAASTPVVFILEDLHWADPSSIDLLRHFSQRISGHRLLVVGTLRPEDVERTNHPLRSVRVEMLAQKQCEEIALGLLTEAHLARHLHVRFAPNKTFRRSYRLLFTSELTVTHCSRRR